HGAVEIGLLQRLPLRRHRLERHLEPALQVESERRLAVDRRALEAEQRHADEGGDDSGEDDGGVATCHGLLRLDRGQGGWLVAAQLRRPNKRRCVASRPASSSGTVTASLLLVTSPDGRSSCSSSASASSSSSSGFTTVAMLRRAMRTWTLSAISTIRS